MISFPLFKTISKVLAWSIEIQHGFEMICFRDAFKEFMPSEKWKFCFTKSGGLFSKSYALFNSRQKICRPRSIQCFFRILKISFHCGVIRFSFVSFQKKTYCMSLSLSHWRWTSLRRPSRDVLWIKLK